MFRIRNDLVQVYIYQVFNTLVIKATKTSKEVDNGLLQQQTS